MVAPLPRVPHGGVPPALGRAQLCVAAQPRSRPLPLPPQVPAARLQPRLARHGAGRAGAWWALGNQLRRHQGQVGWRAVAPERSARRSRPAAPAAAAAKHRQPLAARCPVTRDLLEATASGLARQLAPTQLAPMLACLQDSDLAGGGRQVRACEPCVVVAGAGERQGSWAGTHPRPGGHTGSTG